MLQYKAENEKRYTKEWDERNYKERTTQRMSPTKKEKI